jgi:hypothetical protein
VVGKFVGEMILLNLTDILGAFHDGRAKVFISRNDDEIFGLAKGSKEILLVRK